jgi:hypothetical protein
MIFGRGVCFSEGRPKISTNSSPKTRLPWYFNLSATPSVGYPLLPIYLFMTLSLFLAEFRWSALPNSLLAFVIFGLAGILMAIVGYKLFDLLTPGDLHGEIFEKKNLAAGLLAGSVIIGVCIVLAAAMG